MVLEKTLERPSDSKEITPVNPKGNQSWIFTGRTDAEAETLILWPPNAKSRLTGQDPDSGKDWGQEDKGKTEHEMVEWYHWLNGHEFEETPGDNEGQESLACCSSWGRRFGRDLEPEQQHGKNIGLGFNHWLYLEQTVWSKANYLASLFLHLSCGSTNWLNLKCAQYSVCNICLIGPIPRSRYFRNCS